MFYQPFSVATVNPTDFVGYFYVVILQKSEFYASFCSFFDVKFRFLGQGRRPKRSFFSGNCVRRPRVLKPLNIYSIRSTPRFFFVVAAAAVALYRCFSAITTAAAITAAITTAISLLLILILYFSLSL